MDTLEMIKSKLGDKLHGQELTLQSTFKDFNLDSVDLVDLVCDIEDELGCEFTDDELMELKTIADVVDLIESKKDH